jgi:hypothetical protein
LEPFFPDRSIELEIGEEDAIQSFLGFGFAVCFCVHQREGSFVMHRHLVPVFVLSAFLTLSTATDVLAQVCPGVTLTTQAEVDAFSCSSVTGSLVISGANISNLDGLVALASVGSTLSIYNNAALTNIGGLDALASVGIDLSIFNNDALTNINGLNALVSLGRDLEIYNNDALTNVSGLGALTSVAGHLYIYNNTVLTELAGLAVLASVDGYLTIAYNTALTSIGGLATLASVGTNLSIYNNAALTDLDGLVALASVGVDLSIYSNAVLDIFCGIFPLLDAGGLVGTYTVTNNATNPSEADILAGGACPPAPAVPGLGTVGIAILLSLLGITAYLRLRTAGFVES